MKHLVVLLGTLAVLTACCSPWLVAQTGGPVQPDFAGTQSGTGVDPFTGSFSYSIPVLTVPGPQGSGFSISLSYSSGANPDAGVSWVGYGWTLGPGGIIRDKQGFPDDWMGKVRYYSRKKPVYTITGTNKLDIDMSSNDNSNETQLLSGFSDGFIETYRYNSLTGYSKVSGASLGIKGLNNHLNIGGAISFDDAEDETSWSLFASPNFAFGRELIPGTSTPMNPGTYWTPGNLGGSIGFGSMRTHWPSANILPTTGSCVNINMAFGLGVPGKSGAMALEYGKTSSYSWSSTKGTIIQLDAVGMLYADQAYANSATLMDYFRERDQEYRNTHSLLPIPFYNTDVFSITTPGMGGAFKLHSKKLGVLRPNATNSKTSISQTGFEIQGGVDLEEMGTPPTTPHIRIGFGGDMNIDLGSTSVSSIWQSDLDEGLRFNNTGDEPYYFRFLNDLGGRTDYAGNDNAVRANLIAPDASIWNISGVYSKEGNSDARMGRSWYVAFHTNNELEKKTNRNKPYNAYEKSSSARDFVTRNLTLSKGIGEFAITNPSGDIYVYGLPVYARNERSMSYSIEGLSSSSIENKRTAYTDPLLAPEEEGQEIRDPYASMYLLTQIVSPDYIDITHNGPTNDDIGGWTKFTYRRAAGSNNKADNSAEWYKWRSPYRGLLVDEGMLCEPEDNKGSVMSGEREQYYPETIETKTHIAIFVTNKTNQTYGSKTIQGSAVERRDGYGVSGDVSTFGSSQTATTATYTSGSPAGNIQERLERIELYTKTSAGEPDVLIATAHFDYDYSLRQQMPNSLPVSSGSSDRDGMLTLRKFWVESQGIKNATVSPYTFGYEYAKKDHFAAEVQTLYPSITGYGEPYYLDRTASPQVYSSTVAQHNQNPDYNECNLDMWGDYQANGSDRFNKRISWVNQAPYFTPLQSCTTSVSNNYFDPAAWQLKQIRTPSGGELHIQYEQNDYSFVQDRPAMAMVSLLPSFGSQSSNDGESSNKYYINLEDMGIDVTDRAAVARVRSMIVKNFIDKNDKMLFRFLYALKGTTVTPDNPEYQSDYITGYARVSSCTIEESTSDPCNRPHVYGLSLELKEGGDNTSCDVPKEICYNFVKQRRRGMLSPENKIANSGDAGSMVSELRQKSELALFTKTSHCQAVDYQNSYLRIPLAQAKKGGGARVRRLLTYDPGIKEGGNLLDRTAALYGSEYVYQTFDQERGEWISSGVAANEPGALREDNSLVSIMMDELPSNLQNKVIGGRDKEQYEGPLGVALLPGPSVGYSRVVTKNIYNGITAPGFSVAEFNTTRDYPFDKKYCNGTTACTSSVSHTDIQTNPKQWSAGVTGSYTGGGQPSQSNQTIGGGIRNSENHQELAQGYSFILNNRNGLPKRTATYGGQVDDPASWHLSAEQEFVYFDPMQAATLDYSNDNALTAFMNTVATGKTNDFPGKEQTIVIENRKVQDETWDANIEGDIKLFLPIKWTPLPIDPVKISGKLFLNHENSSLSTHITNKITRYPALLKEIRTYKDGTMQRAENVAVDAGSGQVIITNGFDGYNGLQLQMATTGGQNGKYSSLDLPAYWRYPRMGQKAGNEGAVLPGVSTATVKLDNTATPHKLKIEGSTLPDVPQSFSAGDLIRIEDGSGHVEFYHISNVQLTGSPQRYDVSLLPVQSFWFHNNTTSGMSSGSAVTIISATVVRSGRANQLTATSGTVARYGVNTYSAPTAVSGTNWNAIEVSNMIAASAVNYTDERDAKLCYDGSIGNVYESGQSGKWRPLESYQYRTSTAVTGGGDRSQNQRSYKGAGTFSGFYLGAVDNTVSSIKAFWPDLVSLSPSWLRSGTITNYSRFGLPIESKDALGIYSCTGYDYVNIVPVYQASNARTGNVLFQNCELSSTTSPGHTGRYSINLVSTDPLEDADANMGCIMLYSSGQSSYKYRIRFWAMGVPPGNTNQELPDVLNNVAIKVNGTLLTTPYRRIARTGEWALYENDQEVDLSGQTLDQSLDVIITKNSPEIWKIDDFRMQPVDAEMVGFVYDYTYQRPSASLDPENFAAVPQYNAEGIAVRSKVETERGWRTVAESQGNIPSVSRSATASSLLGQTTRRGTDGNGAPMVSRAAKGPADNRLPGQRPDGSFDLLSFKATLPSPRNILNGGNVTLQKEFKVLGMNPDSLRALKIREPEKFRALEQLAGAKQRVADVNAEIQKETDTAKKELLRDRRNEMLRECRTIMREQLGFSDEDIKQSLQEVESASDDKKENK